MGYCLAPGFASSLIYAVIISLSIPFLTACSNETKLLDRFEAETGETLSFTVDHWYMPFTQTNIYIHFSPPVTNHPGRDFSDLIQISAHNETGAIEKVSRIYDINGSGSVIKVDFENKAASPKHIELTLQCACSGSVEIKSWQPL